VDEIVDEALKSSLDSQMKSADFVAIEHDQVAVPQVPGITSAGAVADSVVQNVNLRVNGYQNKAVGRLLITKTYQSLGDYVIDASADGTFTEMRGLAQNGSKALHKEKVNIRLNGRNVLAGEGITTPASMAMLCADVWGDVNQVMGSNTESVGHDTKYNLFEANRKGVALVPANRPPQNWVGVNKTEPRILDKGGVLNAAGTAWTTQPTAQSGPWTGNQSYIGCSIMDRVTDLQINFTRTGTPSSPATPGTEATNVPTASPGNYLPLNLNLFAEVSKRLEISGGEYKIVYV